MKFQCQGFDQFPLVHAYEKGEKQFLKIVKILPISEVPQNANIINSQTLYKIRQMMITHWH